MNKQEQDLFYNQMDNIIPFMNEKDQAKIDFENSLVNIERLSAKSLMYLLFIWSSNMIA